MSSEGPNDDDDIFAVPTDSYVPPSSPPSGGKGSFLPPVHSPRFVVPDGDAPKRSAEFGTTLSKMPQYQDGKEGKLFDRLRDKVKRHDTLTTDRSLMSANLSMNFHREVDGLDSKVIKWLRYTLELPLSDQNDPLKSQMQDGYLLLFLLHKVFDQKWHRLGVKKGQRGKDGEREIMKERVDSCRKNGFFYSVKLEDAKVLEMNMIRDRIKRYLIFCKTDLHMPDDKLFTADVFEKWTNTYHKNLIRHLTDLVGKANSSKWRKKLKGKLKRPHVRLSKINDVSFSFDSEGHFKDRSSSEKEEASKSGEKDSVTPASAPETSSEPPPTSTPSSDPVTASPPFDEGSTVKKGDDEVIVVSVVGSDTPIPPPHAPHIPASTSDPIETGTKAEGKDAGVDGRDEVDREADNTAASIRPALVEESDASSKSAVAAATTTTAPPSTTMTPSNGSKTSDHEEASSTGHDAIEAGTMPLVSSMEGDEVDAKETSEGVSDDVSGKDGTDSVDVTSTSTKERVQEAVDDEHKGSDKSTENVPSVVIKTEEAGKARNSSDLGDGNGNNGGISPSSPRRATSSSSAYKRGGCCGCW